MASPAAICPICHAGQLARIPQPGEAAEYVCGHSIGGWLIGQRPGRPELADTWMGWQEFVTVAREAARHRFFYDAVFSARVKQAERALIEKAGEPVHHDAETVAFILQVDDMTRADLEARRGG